MSKHTPAPWIDVGVEPDYPRERNIKPGNLYVARTIGGLSADTELANARLIAAAPELLEAIITARKALEVATTPLSEDRQEVLCAMKLADSVIAKATGEEV